MSHFPTDRTASVRSWLTAAGVVFATTLGAPALGQSGADDPALARGQAALAEVIEAHGGLDRWREQGAFRYTLEGFPLSPAVAQRHTQTVDLNTRNNRIDAQAWSVGFDGQTAWATPSIEGVGLPPRFFSLGSSYFILMPFVFADPGVEVRDAGVETYRGVDYRALAVRYTDGVGHSDEDDYILLVDPETNRLAAIHHSVTEIGVERVTWEYPAWQEADGLVVPAELVYYGGYASDREAADGPVTTVSEVGFEVASPDPSIYAAPEGAEIAE